MKCFVQYILPLFILSLLVQSCNDTSIEPGPDVYPITLNATSENSSVSLEWSEVTVSTFEEYFVIRSEEPIPDSPEPELGGTAVVIERIDKVGETEFTDFSTPIVETLYYKVYAKIGDRFLFSETIKVELSVVLLDLRTDVATVHPEKDEFVGYDRQLRLLFVYNYITNKVTSQKTHVWSNPIIRLGEYNGSEEVYVSDGGNYIYILSKWNLSVIAQINTVYPVIDFVHEEGQFIIAQSDQSIALANRSSRLIVDSAFGNNNQRRLLTGARNGSALDVLEVGYASVYKHEVTSNDITYTDIYDDAPPGSSLITSSHPDGDQFIINGSGRVINSDMEYVTTVENGNLFFSILSYTRDGTTLFGVGFQGNDQKLTFFDVEDEYDVISKFPIRQSPTTYFSDDENVYLLSIIFFNGIVRTLITKYAIP